MKKITLATLKKASKQGKLFARPSYKYDGRDVISSDKYIKAEIDGDRKSGNIVLYSCIMRGQLYSQDDDNNVNLYHGGDYYSLRIA